MNTYFSFNIDDRVGKIIFNDQNAPVNMLTTPMADEFERLIDSLNAGQIDVLIMKSAKKDMFIAGADINEIAALRNSAEVLEKSKRGQDIFTKIEQLPFPTIAIIDGACVGGGLELALACTYRLVSDSPATRLGLPETTLGVLPGFGGTWRLPRLIGLSQAIPMILTGKFVTGEKALRLGLVDGCYPAAFLNDEAEVFVSRLSDPGMRKAILKKRRKRNPFVNIIEGNPIGRMFIYAAAKKRIMEKTGGHYPAQISALRTAVKNYRSSRESAMRREREAFSKLVFTDTARNLIALYFTNEALKKSKHAGHVRGVGNAAVLGAGKMGGGIAWLISNAGIPVRMKDINWDAVSKGFAAVNGIYKNMIRIGKTSAREAGLKMQLISGAVDYSGFAGADFVIEAVVENMDIKVKTLKEIEKIVQPDTVIATNTSSISVDAMAQGLQYPERFIGFHFFNPVNRMPLIEVVSGEKTSEETLNKATAFAWALGKIPIQIRDCSGFLVNRILMAYLNEAIILLSEGVRFTRIDAVMKAYGMPMGPFELLDEIGIKVAFKIADIISAAYPEQASGVKIFDIIGRHEELIGKSSGSGFYRYNRKKKTPNRLIDKLIAENRMEHPGRVSDIGIQERCIMRMINEAAHCLEQGIIARPDFLDMAMLLGIGYPAFRGGVLRTADSMGIENVTHTLAEFESKYGQRFKAAGLLAEMNKDKKRFYNR